MNIQQLLHWLSNRMGIRRPVSVLVSQWARVPVVLGWLRPVVLLPAGIPGEMPPEPLEMILAHELAHIRRLDYLWNLLQIAVETMLLCQPAMWWVSRRIREERENCCARQAVSAMGDPRAYARALLRLAEIRCLSGDISAPAGSIAADGGSLESRIRRVLGLPVGSGCNGNVCLGGILAVLLLAIIVLVNITWAVGHSSDDRVASPDKTAAASPLSMTVEAFGKLSPAKQRDVLVRAFQQRLDLSKNLFLEHDQFDRGYEDHHGEPGKPLKKEAGFRARYRVWRFGDSFKNASEYNKNTQTGAFSSSES
jgi:hypothetical protein